MAIELNVPTDPGALAIPGVYINKFQIISAPNFMKIAFAEEGLPGQLIYRVAVVLTPEDAAELAQAILKMVGPQKEPQQTSSKA